MTWLTVTLRHLPCLSNGSRFAAADTRQAAWKFLHLPQRSLRKQVVFHTRSHDSPRLKRAPSRGRLSDQEVRKAKDETSFSEHRLGTPSS